MKKNSTTQLGLEQLEKREVLTASMPHIVPVDVGQASVAAVETAAEVDGAQLTAAFHHQKVMDVTEVESNDTKGTANKLPLGIGTDVRLRGSVRAKDVDYFTFEASENSFLRMKIAGSEKFNLNLTVENSAGKPVFSMNAANEAGGTVKLSQGEQYFIRVQSSDGQPVKYEAMLNVSFPNDVPVIRGLTATEGGTTEFGAQDKSDMIDVQEVEFNDTPDAANVLPLSFQQDVMVHGMANGKEDTDYFAFKSTQNSILNVDLRSLSDTAIKLQIEDASGHVMFKSTSTAQDVIGQGKVKLSRGEQYFVRVATADGTAGKYEVRLSLNRPTIKTPVLSGGANAAAHDDDRRFEHQRQQREDFSYDALVNEARDEAFANNDWR